MREHALRLVAQCCSQIAMKHHAGHRRTMTRGVVIIDTPILVQGVHISGRQRWLDERMRAIDSRIEHANRGDVRAGPDNSLSEVVRPCMLVAGHIFCKKHWRVAGSTEFRDRASREQHQFDCRTRSENGNDDDLRKIQSPVGASRATLRREQTSSIAASLSAKHQRPHQICACASAGSACGSSVQNVSSRAVRIASIDSTLPLFGGFRVFSLNGPFR